MPDMKILLSSHAFSPQIGGIETVSELLAEGMVQAGHEVTLVTHSLGAGSRPFPFPVHRRPSPTELFGLVRWADLVFHSNISLRTAWPLLLVRRPWVITHHGELLPTARGRCKRRLASRAYNVCVSRAIADRLGQPAVVQPNPYDARVFRPIPNLERHRTLVFVGRLVTVKGVATLLNALTILRTATGLTPDLTLVGDGPERSNLERLATASGLETQVAFVGPRRGEALATLLNQSRILVVPSLSDEPFGVVALEGIACGCAVIGSHGGGLKDAIGPCGLTFPNGDARQLAERLETLLGDPEIPARLHRAADRHLCKHRPERVTAAYLEILSRARRGLPLVPPDAGVVRP